MGYGVAQKVVDAALGYGVASKEKTQHGLTQCNPLERLAKMPHTPGPWYATLSTSLDRGPFIAITDGPDGAGTPIAKIWKWNDAHLDAEAHGNAHLIAAAPTLKRLLLRAVQTQGPFGDDSRPDWWDEANRLLGSF